MKELSDRELKEVRKYANTIWAIYKNLLEQVGYHEDYKWDYKTEYDIKLSAASINSIRKAGGMLYKVAEK